MTANHNITFEFCLNIQTRISGPCWLASDQYGLLITVGVSGFSNAVKT